MQKDIKEISRWQKIGLGDLMTIYDKTNKILS